MEFQTNEEVNMVMITNKAREELKNLLLLHTEDMETGIRLVCGSLGQFGLKLSKPEDGDDVVQDQGLRILMVGSNFKDVLNAVTLDVEYSNGKREFVMAKK
jgi:Fe-S cluster assembly iron-binding protein IscA